MDVLVEGITLPFPTLSPPHMIDFLCAVLGYASLMSISNRIASPDINGRNRRGTVPDTLSAMKLA